MTIFQKAANWIKNWQAPAWLKLIMQELNDIMVSILLQVGKAYLDYVKNLIIEAAEHDDWTPGEKFDYVVKNAKKGFIEFGITLKDNQINTLVNYLVSWLKDLEVID